MTAETAQLEKTRDELQRREWLLLEFLSSDRKTRKLYDQEIARSMERVSTVAGWIAELAQCDDGHWMTLGPCVSARAQPPKT